MPEVASHERADSRRKRLRLIEAARAAVAEHGMEASTAEIASRAEVGVGTLYRRFGSKEALVHDVLVDGIAEIQAAADAALADEDPWRALAGFVVTFTGAQVANRGVAEFTAAHSAELPEDIQAYTTRLAASFEQLTARAQAAGVLRPDVNWRDIVLLCVGPVGAEECLGARASDNQWRRTIAIALDGLRTPEPSPLPDE